MFYVTDKHPDALGIWTLCNDGKIIEKFAGAKARILAMSRLVREQASKWSLLASANSDTLISWDSDAIAFVNTMTDDKRILEGQISFRQFPLPLMAQLSTSYGHEGAFIIGRIDTASVSGGSIPASGMIDTAVTCGAEVVQMLSNDMLTGISIDIGKIGKVETEYIYPEDTTIDPYDYYPIDYIDHFVDVEIAGATLCTIPAFADARIRLTSEAPVLASAESVIPIEPPVDWFRDPEFSGRTRMTILDSGQIFGHLAPHGECHIGIQGRCVTVPLSNTNYSWFTLGTMKCAEGCEIPIGTITMDTGHASKDLSARAAASHYDNTGTVIADITVGEDEFGVWVAGALRSDATPEKIRALRASRLSGDWRDVNGNLELVAALAVNVGGFPVNEESLFADGSVQTLLIDSDSETVQEVQAASLGDVALRAAIAPLLKERATLLAERVHKTH